MDDITYICNYFGFETSVNYGALYVDDAQYCLFNPGWTSSEMTDWPLLRVWMEQGRGLT